MVFGSPNSAPGAVNQPEQALRRALATGPRSSQALQHALGISQAGLSRTIQKAAPNVIPFRISGQRTPLYGLLRLLDRTASRQHMYQINERGEVLPAGIVTLLVGGQTLVEDTIHGSRLYAGLSPAMTFAAPSGYLGRHAAVRASARIGVPQSLDDWDDDDRASYLFMLETDAPGDIVFGDEALGQMLEQRKSRVVIKRRDKAAAYVRFATDALHAAVGSSAGGQQPKFTAETEDVGHVIVKFAKEGTRMADLLVLEHLALTSVISSGLPAAKTNILRAGGLMFLESQRFDRVGRFGRLGFVSAGAFDDENFGERRSWSDFADKCQHSRFLDGEQADIIHVFAAFSELIGNTDTHFENLSLRVDAGGRPIRTAPAYDLLPMRYASQGAGMDPELVPLSPKLGGLRATPRVWYRAHEAAHRFWENACQDTRVSKEMRVLASKNLDAIDKFVQPLIASASPPAATAVATTSKRARPRAAR